MTLLMHANGVVKYKDPGKPTVLIQMGNNATFRALVDLGASVNIIPTHIYEKLGLGEYQPTNIHL